MPLFTRMASNPKTAKGESLPYEGVILHLAPHDLGGGLGSERSVCPHASEGCIDSCLNTAGRGRMDSVQEARVRRTHAFWDDRSEFLWALDSELSNLETRAERKGLTPIARLNGTSDISWEAFQADSPHWGEVSIMNRHPGVTFYDYTKSVRRAEAFAEGRFEPGYHLTYSKTERDSLSFTSSLVRSGVNVAVVFRHRIPKTLDGLPVIDGTQHDYRFLDDPYCYVGLIALGRAKGDRTGFVLDTPKGA